MIVLDVISYALLLVSIWFVTAVFLLLLVYGSEFKRFWQEPMLPFPVVIFESDDWGVGSEDQVSALVDLLQLFSQYQDQNHHHPVLTLGMILAEPDVDRISLENQTYYYRDLGDERYHDLVKVIKKGQQQRIFSVHLHGMEHFWPDSLMNSVQKSSVEQWLFATDSDRGVIITEDLPAYLQSRWCDTSVLPSVPLKEQEIARAVEAEIKCFNKVFEQQPKVVVPPTFVWTDQVIKQYLLHNINCFITPGKQFVGRDREGVLQSNGRTFYNGDTEPGSDVLYLVRDIYFEPKLRHKAERVLTDIINRTNCARPSLIEMHRFNFLSDKQSSLKELKVLLTKICKQLPETLFLSAEELAASYQEKNCLVDSAVKRFWVLVKRIQLFLQYKKLAKYSGFNLFLSLIIVVK